MGERYECGDVSTDLEVVGPGAVLGEEELSPDRFALVIGNPWASAYAIEGRLEDLMAFAQRLTSVVSEAHSRAEAGPGALGAIL